MYYSASGSRFLLTGCEVDGAEGREAIAGQVASGKATTLQVLEQAKYGTLGR